MPNLRFDSPISVRVEAGDRPRVVCDTMHAAEILLRRWPVDRRDGAYQLAVKSCLDAMEGHADAAAAGKAFIRAARRAKILLRIAGAKRS
jgi:hypothetical protein